MTEVEWLGCDAPTKLLSFVAGTVSERKLRLFACACCRCVWSLLEYTRCRPAVEDAERYADRPCETQSLEAALRQAQLEVSCKKNLMNSAKEAYLREEEKSYYDWA